MNFSGITLDLLRSITRIITHADCPDGIASAMILHDALPKATIEFVQYNTPEHRDLTATSGMLFCDMTPPRERVQEFVAADAIVLDHHKGAEDIVAAFGERGVFADEVADPGVSGAHLAYCVWRECVGRSRYPVEWSHVRDLAALAGIRDTWQRMDPRWDDACAQVEVLHLYACESERGFPALNHVGAMDLGVGRALLRRRLQAARDVAQRKLYRLGGWRVFNDGDKAFGHGMISDVAEAVRELDPEAIGVCGFHYAVQSNGCMDLVFSLRSCGDMDVSAIARANGGGGHTKAAGFSVPVSSVGLDPIGTFTRCLPVPS